MPNTCQRKPRLSWRFRPGSPRAFALLLLLLLAPAFAAMPEQRAYAQSLTEGYRLVGEWVTTDISGTIPDFSRPRGIDVADDGTIYIVDSGLDRVFHLSSTGQALQSWQVSGIGDPQDVAVSPGAVHVIGISGGRIYDRDGGNPRPWTVSGAQSVAYGAGNRVYVAKLGSTAIVELYDVNGNLQDSWTDANFPVFEVFGMDVAADGRIYLAADGAIFEFAPGGMGGMTAQKLLQVSRRIEGPNILDVAVDGTGKVYAVLASSTARFVGWDASGNYIDDLSVAGARYLAVGPGGGAVISTFTNGFAGITQLRDRNDFGGDPVRWGDNRNPLGKIEAPRRIATGQLSDAFLLDKQDVVQHWSDAGVPQQQWSTGGYAVDVAGGATLPCYASGTTINCLQVDPANNWSVDIPSTGWLTALDGNGSRVAALDLADQLVRLYRQNDGGVVGSFPLDPSGSGYMAASDIAMEGNLVYLADQANRRIDIRNIDGSQAGIITTQSAPLRVDVAGGRVYVLGNGGYLWKYDGSGTLITVFRPVTNGIANDIGATDLGRVYVPDPPNDRVLVYEPGNNPPDDSQIPAAVSDKCVVQTNKTAAPPEVRVGDQATIQLEVSGACPLGDGRLDVVLIVDESGSMNGSPMAAAQNAALAFLNELNPGAAQVGLVAFDTSAVVLQSLTSDLRQVVRGVSRLDAGGQTNYVDALEKAIGEFKGPAVRPGVAKVAVMMSDGKPTTDDGVLEAAARLKALGVTVFTIGLGLTIDQKQLQDVASSPDLFFLAPSEAALAEVYREIAKRIVSARIITQATVVDELPTDMVYIPGSAVPPPLSVNGQTLTWQLNNVPPTGRTISYRVRPTREGQRVTNVRAVIDYTDATGVVGSKIFPVPQIQVLPAGNYYAFLPFLAKNLCKLDISDIILAFDTSGSMQEPAGGGLQGTKLEAAIEAGRAFLSAVDFPNDQVGIVAFSDRARLVQPLTTSRGALTFALNNLQTEPGTRIDRGIESSMAELLGPRHRQGNKPVIILMTDGRPTAGTEGEVLGDAATARGLGFSLFTIGLGPDTDRLLLSLIAGSNDRSFFAPSGAELNRVYDLIAGKALCED
jgi:Mg-chelatase subunit ChlD